MNIFIKSLFLFSSCFAAQDLSFEPVNTSSIENLPEVNSVGISYTKKYWYGSLAFDPGVGFSYRNRTNAFGYSFDAKAGVFPLGVGMSGAINTGTV